MLLAMRLIDVARENGHETGIGTDSGWRAQPVVHLPLQHDGHLCGVWILAAAFTVFKSRHISALEEDIHIFRQTIHKHILLLPMKPLQ